SHGGGPSSRNTRKPLTTIPAITTTTAASLARVINTVRRRASIARFSLMRFPRSRSAAILDTGGPDLGEAPETDAPGAVPSGHGLEDRVDPGARDRRRPGEGVLREDRLPRRLRPPGARGPAVHPVHAARLGVLHRPRGGHHRQAARKPGDPGAGGRRRGGPPPAGGRRGPG